MAKITVAISSTQLVAQLFQTIQYNLTELDPLGSTTYTAAEEILSAPPMDQDPSHTVKISESDRSLKRTDTFKNYGSDLQTGSVSQTFTGTNLSNANSANATALTYKSTLKTDDGYSKYSDSESISLKLAAFNPLSGNELTITSAATTISSSDNSADQKNSFKLSSNLSGLFNFDANGLTDFSLKNLTTKSTQNISVPGEYSGSSAYSLAVKSSNGLNFDSAAGQFSGTIDSFNYTFSTSAKSSGFSFGLQQSYQSGAWTNEMIEALNDALIGGSSAQDALLEALFAGDDVIKTSNKYGAELYGGAGNDVITGGAGKDLLDGGSGNDKLNGGKGDDLLVGGAGTDILTGGAGADQFIFFAGDSTTDRTTMDTVTDFKIKQNDKLVFNFGNIPLTDDDIVIALGKTDKQTSYDALLTAAQTSAQNGTLIYVGYTSQDKKNGYAFVDLDGDGSIDMGIKLTGVTSSNKINAGSFSKDMSDYLGYDPMDNLPI